ncbi:hypothetical protein B484DRAFT_439599, partial [Ochromonadaceae sp. CCMP2298]
MREYSLGDVSLDMWSREFFNLVAGINTELYIELESKEKFDWEISRPLAFVSTPDVRTRRGVREPYYRLWNDARDGDKLAKETEVWEKMQADYARAKKKLWPITMSTLTSEVRTEVMGHYKFPDLARVGDTLGLWDLLGEIMQGITMNNTTLLRKRWKALRFLLGTSFATFMVRFNSYISQIDHAAAGCNESLLSDSTKTYQLVVAFHCDALDVALGAAITTAKNSDEYPSYEETVLKLKTTIAGLAPGELTEVKGKKQRVNSLGGNGGNDFGHQGAAGGNTPKSANPGGDWKPPKKSCWKCGKKGSHLAQQCNAKTVCKEYDSPEHCIEFHEAACRNSRSEGVGK